MIDERDDFVSGGGAVAWALVAIALALMLFLLFVLGLTPAWAGCVEVCASLPSAEWTRVGDCCCEQHAKVSCDVPTPVVTATPACDPHRGHCCYVPEFGWVPCEQPTCAEASPTPLPTPASEAKGACCREAIRLTRAEKRAAYVTYRGAIERAQARLTTMRAECQDGDEHGRERSW